MLQTRILKAFHVCLGFPIVIMIAGIQISQEIFAIDACVDSFKIIFGAMSEACYATVMTIWRPGFRF